VLLQNQTIPEYTGSDWEDVADYALLMQGYALQCNVYKKYMRALKEAKSPEPG
jgi:hypothetical protein